VQVAVVGGGASGVLVAANLIQQGYPRDSITIFEPVQELGRGNAYQQNPDCYRLNTRAGVMSAFTDRPDEFSTWYKNRGGDPNGFAPRSMFGEYLNGLVHGVPHVRELVTSLHQVDSFDFVILATGVISPSLPGPLASINDSERLIRDPWSFVGIRKINPSDSVLIIGTGLSMVDVVLGLMQQGHRGAIDAVSRHGLLPRPHGQTRKVAFVRDPGKAVRKDVYDFVKQFGSDWRSGMDAIRPHVRSLYESMSLTEQRQFLRHARTYWDIHRHRMPPESYDTVTGHVQLHADVLIGSELRSTDLSVLGRDRNYKADWIVIATGPTPLGQSPAPLWKSLIAHGATCLDPHRLGVELNPNGQLPGDPRFFAIGQVAIGQRWETTAIPDLRTQAREIADCIIYSSQPRR